MNYGTVKSRICASLLAVVVGWATSMAVTLPMQVYQIVTNDLGGRRSLLWSLGAGILVWLGWTLMIAAGGWLFACLPAIVFFREEWLLRHRSMIVAGSAVLALTVVIIEMRTWRMFLPEFDFHPWAFFLYTLLLMVFAIVTAAVYLRLAAARAAAAALDR